MCLNHMRSEKYNHIILPHCSQQLDVVSILFVDIQNVDIFVTIVFFRVGKRHQNCWEWKSLEYFEAKPIGVSTTDTTKIFRTEIAICISEQGRCYIYFFFKLIYLLKVFLELLLPFRKKCKY